MRIIFAGTPEFAQRQLQALINAAAKLNIEIVAVYTQPDRPVGRGLKLQASAVKQCALASGLSVEQPLNFKSQEAQETFKAYQPDLMVVSAYGLILPKTILDIPVMGCWNIHGSLLPRWRGAAPIQQAILAGDSHTGITLMQMNEGLDTGDMLAKATTPISPQNSSADLHEKLAHLGADLLLELLATLNNKQPLNPIPQDNALATLAPKIKKTQAKLDWNQTSEQLLRAIRAFNPWPVAHTHLDDLIIKVWDAQIIQIINNLTPNPLHPGTIISQSSLGIDVATGNGCLRLTTIQLPDKRKMPVCEILNSKKELFMPGSCFN